MTGRTSRTWIDRVDSRPGGQKKKTLCAQHTKALFAVRARFVFTVCRLARRGIRSSCGVVEDDTDKMVREQGTGPGFVLKIRWDGAMTSASVPGCLSDWSPTEPSSASQRPACCEMTAIRGEWFDKIKPSCSPCKSSHLAPTVKLLSGFRVCRTGNGATGGKRGASERLISRSSRPAQQKRPPVAGLSFFTCQSESKQKSSFGRIHRTPPHLGMNRRAPCVSEVSFASFACELI